MAHVEEIDNTEALNRQNEIDNQLWAHKNRILALQEKINYYRRCEKEHSQNYDQTYAAKQRFERMIEDTISHAKKNLCDRDDSVKILKKSYNRIKDTLYGAQMQETNADLSNGMKEILQKIAECDTEIARLEQEITQLNGQIYRLTQERNDLDVK